MLLDLTPASGQYADTSTAADKYSIFHSHIDGSGVPDTLAIYQDSSITYLDEDGKPDTVYDERSGTFVPPISSHPAHFPKNSNYHG